MTSLWEAVVLGALQGATEFLPVSSSGHLVIVPEILGWHAAGLQFDVAVHWATAFALLLYFRRDWYALLAGSVRARPLWPSREGRLLAFIAVGSVPAVVAGLAVRKALERELAQDPRGAARAAAAMLLVTGLLILGAELTARLRSRGAQAEEVGLIGALAVGAAQAFALVPGISRSGATMAAGMVAGLRRDEAARFSFLLGTPVIVGAGLLEMGDFAIGRPSAPEAAALIAGGSAAFVCGYLVIAWLMRYLRRAPLYPFVAYTWIAGALALWWLR